MPGAERNESFQLAIVIGALGALACCLARPRTRGALGEDNSARNQVWYHGSPWKISTLKSSKLPALFVSDSKRVACEYTKHLIGTGMDRQDSPSERDPSLYEIGLRFEQDKIFDTRKPEHRDLYLQIAREAREEDPDTTIRKSNLWRVHPVPGSSIAGEFPGYGQVYELLPRLTKFGFMAAYIAEGAQGGSLAIWRPQENAKILDVAPASVCGV